MRSVFLCSLMTAMLAVGGCTAPGKPHEQETLAENVSDFHTLFTTNCAGCHGQNGMNGPGRILNDSLYLSFIPKAELKKVLIYGRRGTAMPAWSKAQGGPLTDKQIDVLTDGIYSSWGHSFQAGAAPIPSYTVNAVSGDAANGKKLFTRNCYMCHGPGAKVGVVTSRAYLELVSNQMLRTSIVVGRADLGMPNYQHLKLGKALSDSDVTNLVAYLVSLRQMPAPGEGAEPHITDNGVAGEITRGNAGSGNGPGSPTQNQTQGNKTGNSSQAGGTIDKSSKEMR